MSSAVSAAASPPAVPPAARSDFRAPLLEDAAPSSSAVGADSASDGEARNSHRAGAVSSPPSRDYGAAAGAPSSHSSLPSVVSAVDGGSQQPSSDVAAMRRKMQQQDEQAYQQLQESRRHRSAAGDRGDVGGGEDSGDLCDLWCIRGLYILACLAFCGIGAWCWSQGGHTKFFGLLYFALASMAPLNALLANCTRTRSWSKWWSRLVASHGLICLGLLVWLTRLDPHNAQLPACWIFGGPLALASSCMACFACCSEKQHGSGWNDEEGCQCQRGSGCCCF